MKKLIFIVTFFIFCTVINAQTFKSPYAILINNVPETEMKAREITVTDKQIGITKFIAGVTTQFLIVNKIEEKEYSFDGVCKYYYCTIKDKDPVNGYQKAIVIKASDKIILALFATEIDVYVYQFAIK